MVISNSKVVGAVGILALITAIGTIVSNLNGISEAKLVWETKTPTGTFKAYVDDNPVPVLLKDVVCNGIICEVPLKELNLVAGHHLIQMTNTLNGVESVKSIPVEVNFIVTSDKSGK